MNYLPFTDKERFKDSVFKWDWNLNSQTNYLFHILHLCMCAVWHVLCVHVHVCTMMCVCACVVWYVLYACKQYDVCVHAHVPYDVCIVMCVFSCVQYDVCASVQCDDVHACVQYDVYVHVCSMMMCVHVCSMMCVHVCSMTCVCACMCESTSVGTPVGVQKLTPSVFLNFSPLDVLRSLPETRVHRTDLHI